MTDVSKEPLFERHYPIPSYMVNLRGQAGLFAILNFIQDVGWLHGREMKVSLPKDRGWVFTRQKLMMTKWPMWNEDVVIRTWLRPPQGYFLIRDYELFMKDQRIGVCSSTFTMMDLGTRKIATPDWSPYESLWRKSDHLDQTPEKIPWRDDGACLAKFNVRNSDIDLNNHVNNAKYAQWVLDSIPIEVLKHGEHLDAYEINFLAETRLGDEVVIETMEPPREPHEPRRIQFQGRKDGNGKPIFSVRLTVSEIQGRS